MSVLLVPATRENLETSIENSVDLEFARKYLDEKLITELLRLSGNEGIRCWAVTKNKRKLYNDIRKGDEVLLTEKGTGLFSHYGIVIGKTRNVEFGKALWPISGQNPWEYIYFLANIQNVSFIKKQIIIQFGYRESFTVPGATMAKKDRYPKFDTISKKFEIPVYSYIAENNEDKDYSAQDIQVSGKRRQGHAKFSKTIKENYGYSCAICGITEPEFLISGHISTWAEDENNRLNPKNGICLCSLHDKAFEHGYISLDDDYNIILNKKIKHQSVLFKELARFDHKKIKLPAIFCPGIEYLRNHRRKHGFE